MDAKDLIELVLKEEQKHLAENAIPEKVGMVLSNDFFKVLWVDLFKRTRIEVDFNRIKIVENSDIPYIKDLNKPVFEGYWVYFYFCSVEYHEFKWYQTLSEAEKEYMAMDNMFCGRRMLIHTEKGVLKYESE